ncbi:MAG: TM2 domain-containing protein [Phycisphaerae bacterium]|nr:TM2 domain-containing protein [Phycisphaerae bacterium]MCZ2398355.1 TM2 domain-containing protein [Phycisphaerae bacterium]
MFCRNCGAQLSTGDSICYRCGAAAAGAPGAPPSGYGAPPNAHGAPPAYGAPPVYGAAPGHGPLAPVEQKSKIVAGILGIVLGSLGVHRFYLGFVGIGLLQILVTAVTCGAGGLWGFIEGILLLVGSMDRDARGVPLKD